MSKKDRVAALMKTVNSYDADAARDVLHRDYEQHNPFIPDKAEGLIGLYPAMKDAGVTVETLLLLEDGEHVVAFNRWHNAEIFGHGCHEMVAFDFFKVNEDGALTGHWDAMMCDREPNASGRTLTDGLTAPDASAETESNKRSLETVFDALIRGTDEEVQAAVGAYFQPHYKQHNPDGSDGVEGFQKAQMSAEVKPRWLFERQHIVVGEGDYVLSISEGRNNGVHSVFYDLVRFEDGRIAEHWDVIQAVPVDGLANGNTMFNF